MQNVRACVTSKIPFRNFLKHTPQPYFRRLWNKFKKNYKGEIFIYFTLFFGLFYCFKSSLWLGAPKARRCNEVAGIDIELSDFA